jgi:RNA polymerase sigma-70 factor, ECF subfamily
VVGTATVMAQVRSQDNVTVDASAALARLYDETLPRVYGFFLHRVGGNVGTAEDLTQETYLAAVREVRRGNPGDDPIRWLFGIARHKLLDHYRRQGRDRGLVVPWYEGIEDDVSIPSFDLGLDEDRARVVDALGVLPVSQQAVMSLRYLDGWAVPEIAQALGKTVHAIESLLARGRVNFKRALTEAVTGHE